MLVPHPLGGPVDGGLLLLAGHLELGQATDLLAEREGLLSARGVVQVDLPGDRLVLAASLPRNLPAPDMTPAALARRAVASVHADGRRNGVRYLRRGAALGHRHAAQRGLPRRGPRGRPERPPLRTRSGC